MASVVLVVCGLVAWGAEAGATAPDLAAYDAARAGVGRGADAHVKLALWCEARGLKAERLKHLALAVLIDPKNATARGLMGLVDYRGRWNRPEAVAEKVKADEALTARLAGYNSRRARTEETADGQWELAVWCERNGLETEARAHFLTVTRLDPGREAAWKRLGYRKVGGRWVNDAGLAAERAEADAQKHAEKVWKPLLTKYRAWLGDKDRARRDKAVAALAEVRDPRAVPSVWSAFVEAGQSHHPVAVQLLGQIDAVGSSRALALLAVSDDSAEVRRAAAETLKRRDVREFADLLIAMIKPPVKYDVKAVAGQGAAGTLTILGKQANVQRVYTPPAVQMPAILPTDRIGYDQSGQPVAFRRFLSGSYIAEIPNQTLPQVGMPAELARALPEFIASHGGGQAGREAAQKAVQNARASTLPAGSRQAPDGSIVLPNGIWNPRYNVYQTTTVGIPVGQIMAEAAAANAAAQRQLDGDVEKIESYNATVGRQNDRVLGVLDAASGQKFGPDPDAWSKWWVDQIGMSIMPQKSQDPATVVEQVPIDFQPNPAAQVAVNQSEILQHRLVSCFGAGTPVRTLTGLRPIESLEVGDLVLTQDAGTGALGYQPVVKVHRNPPSPTFRIALEDQPIISSAFHRFWAAGRGWVMARDLKPGDEVRTLDGLVRVSAVEDDRVQPVFNLDVAEAHDFFAGAAGALVHDNTLPDTRMIPFDAAPALASAAR